MQIPDFFYSSIYCDKLLLIAIHSGLDVNLFLKSLYLLDMFSQEMSHLW